MIRLYLLIALITHVGVLNCNKHDRHFRYRNIAAPSRLTEDCHPGSKLKVMHDKVQCLLSSKSNLEKKIKRLEKKLIIMKFENPTRTKETVLDLKDKIICMTNERNQCEAERKRLRKKIEKLEQLLQENNQQTFLTYNQHQMELIKNENNRLHNLVVTLNETMQSQYLSIQQTSLSNVSSGGKFEDLLNQCYEDMMDREDYHKTILVICEKKNEQLQSSADSCQIKIKKLNEDLLACKEGGATLLYNLAKQNITLNKCIFDQNYFQAAYDLGKIDNKELTTSLNNSNEKLVNLTTKYNDLNKLYEVCIEKSKNSTFLYNSCLRNSMVTSINSKNILAASIAIEREAVNYKQQAENCDNKLCDLEEFLRLNESLIDCMITNRNYEKQVDLMHEEFTANLTQRDNKIKKLQENFDDCSSNLTERNNKIKKLQEQAILMSVNFDECSSNLTQRDSKIKKLQEQAILMSVNYDECTSNLTERDNRIKKLQENFDECASNLTEKNDKIKKLQEQAILMSVNFDECSSNLTERDKKIKGLQSSVNSLRNSVTQLQLKVIESENDVTTLANIQQKCAEQKVVLGLKVKFCVVDVAVNDITKGLLKVDGHVFYIPPDPFNVLSWYRAQDFCKSHGMELVAIDSQKKQQSIDTIFSNVYEIPLWTDANRLGSDSEFYHAGTGNKVDSSAAWPDWKTSSDGSCVVINRPEQSSSLKWETLNCNGKFLFICEMTSPCAQFVN